MMVDLKLPKERIMISEAPSWKRALSFGLDLVVLQIILSPLSTVFQGFMADENDFLKNYAYVSSIQDTSGLYLAVGCMFLIIFLYFVLFELKLGQTPGKMMLRLYVKCQEKNEKLTLWKVIVRNLAAIPIPPFYFLLIADPLYLLITGRRLSDKLSKTTVVEEVLL